MKRSLILVISCACALAIALFAMTACGGASNSPSGSASSSAASSDANGANGADTANPDDASGSGMSEFYKGSTPVGEQLYYAGGADGAGAIFVLIVPESNTSAIFIGPATVGEDNKLTITDETTGSSITFAVIDNGDGTYSFSMGDEYGAAIMTRCSSNEIIDALTDVVMASPAAQPAGEGSAQEQPQE